jgi:5-(carboxyamino)imidazole ribonucleotide mutase
MTMATNALRGGAERARSTGRRKAPVLEIKRAAVKTPLVGIVMGSTSDWDTMRAAARILDEFAVSYEAKAMSAHRTPVLVSTWASSAASRGVRCIIAGAGGAAHLAGVVAAHTTLPVLGVPMPSKHLQGLDSLLSTVQMPKGIPVATFAIGEAGAANAALFAIAMLALSDAALASRLAEFRLRQAEAVARAELPKP